MHNPREILGSERLYDQAVPEIPTERPGVVLQRFTVSDAEALFEAVDSDRAHVSQFGEPTGSREAYTTVASTRESIRLPKNLRQLHMGIWNHERLVGSMRLTPQEDAKGAEVGYWLRGDATKRGYATIALKALAQYSFTELGYAYLVAAARHDNLDSQAVLQRAGFAHMFPDAPEQVMVDFYLNNPYKGEANGEL
jgi:RimJ/RimL family protein N-acetyltransferase